MSADMTATAQRLLRRTAEQGTHSALLAKNGAYARLWQHQAGGFM